MPAEKLKKIIEALLFVSEKPLTVRQIAEVCDENAITDIKAAVKSLQEDYNLGERGIHIQEVAGGYRFSTSPDCAEYLKKLYTKRRVFRLSAPALETLAIIAYKQPVTRAEIEFIRGVNVDGVVKTLEERQLIKNKGRKDVLGRPMLYGTTEEFLHYFGLKSLDDLPTLEEFTAQELQADKPFSLRSGQSFEAGAECENGSQQQTDHRQLGDNDSDGPINTERRAGLTT